MNNPINKNTEINQSILENFSEICFKKVLKIYSKIPSFFDIFIVYFNFFTKFRGIYLEWFSKFNLKPHSTFLDNWIGGIFSVVEYNFFDFDFDIDVWSQKSS